MPRLREVPLAQRDAKVAKPLYAQLFGERDPVAEPGTATGTRGDWWTVFANSPDRLKHAAQGLAYYRSPERKLDPVLRGLGVSEDKIAALPVWQSADVFDTRERLVLAYADRLMCHGGRVPDALLAEVKAQFSDEEILKLTDITCLYHMHAIMSRALRTEFDDRDDPVVEVAAPEGFDALGFPGDARR